MIKPGIFSSVIPVPAPTNLKDALLKTFNEFSMVPLGGRAQHYEIYDRLRNIFDINNLREFEFNVEIDKEITVIPLRQIDIFALQGILLISGNKFTLKELCQQLNSKYE